MRYFSIVIVVLILASCSAPRMASVSSGKPERYITISTYRYNQQVVASADPEQLVVADVPAEPVPTAAPIIKASYNKKVKSQTLPLVNHHYESPYPESLDEDLKWSIILGAAGMVGILLTVISQVFGIIGGLMLIGGVVMFAKWFLRQ